MSKGLAQSGPMRLFHQSLTSLAFQESKPGIQVFDGACFSRIVEILKNSARDETVYVSGQVEAAQVISSLYVKYGSPCGYGW